MFEKWKKKSIFGKISDIIFIVFLAAMFTPTGRMTIGGWVNRLTAQIRNPSKIEGISLQDSDYNWQLEGTNGQQINLSDYKGKVLFVNEWATWCPPCVGEMPEIEALYQKFKDNPNIKFLMISNQGIPLIKNFIQQKGFSFPVYSARSSAPKPFQSKSIPTSFLISKTGKIVIQETGAMNWGGSKMEKIVNELIE